MLLWRHEQSFSNDGDTNVQFLPKRKLLLPNLASRSVEFEIEEIEQKCVPEIGLELCYPTLRAITLVLIAHQLHRELHG
jgi:hypothetical protein